MSSLAAAHLHLFKRVMALLDEQGARDIKVIGGGIIPEQDIDKLKSMGVHEIFLPGTPLASMITWVRENIHTP
jgi:methylmalonyl-CoA mutase C-terminal domain/subunit